LPELTSILITGAPAAGKSTVRPVVRAELERRFEPVNDLGIDDVLRDLYASGALPDARLDQRGALLLSRPERDVPIAMARLGDLYATAVGSSVVEAPIVHGWLSSVAANHPFAAARTLVVCLRASTETRVERNSRRGEERIDPDNLLQMPTELSTSDLEALFTGYWGVVAFDTEGPLARTIGVVRATIAAIVDGDRANQ
jgi:hypothetical protein